MPAQICLVSTLGPVAAAKSMYTLSCLALKQQTVPETAVFCHWFARPWYVAAAHAVVHTYCCCCTMNLVITAVQ